MFHRDFKLFNSSYRDLCSLCQSMQVLTKCHLDNV